MVDLCVTLAGVELKNPVIPASGTFGYGREFAELYNLNILGSFSFKGTTGKGRFGNPQPRIAETPCGMLNAVGLQNPGVDAVIAEELPHIAKIFNGPVIANVGGFSPRSMRKTAASWMLAGRWDCWKSIFPVPTSTEGEKILAPTRKVRPR